VQQDHRVVVDVHDPAFRRDGLRYFVSIIRGGNPGTDIEKLPDTRLTCQEADGASEERAPGAYALADSWVNL
jgi:hypothetical protein